MSQHIDRKVFARPPVALVVVEAGFSQLQTPAAEHLDELRSALKATFPVFEPIPTSVSQINPLADPPIETRSLSVPRFSTRENTAAIAVTEQAVVIETTKYFGLDWYCEFLEPALAAVASILRPDALTSLGCRYIDEVRVPTTDSKVDWTQWFPESLTSMACMPSQLGMQLHDDLWQAAMSYQLSAESWMTLRYGPADGYAVDPNGRTRRLDPPPAGPFFLLDWDSRWQPAIRPEFTSAVVLNQCRELYGPVRAMFHHLVDGRLATAFNADTGERP